MSKPCDQENHGSGAIYIEKKQPLMLECVGPIQKNTVFDLLVVNFQKKLIKQAMPSLKTEELWAYVDVSYGLFVFRT